MLGGGDMNLTLYGHHGEVPNLSGVTGAATNAPSKRSAGDFSDVSRLRDLPWCPGDQRRGRRTLIPDLGPGSPRKGHGDDPAFVDDPVLIEACSRLASILGRTSTVVRNGHHQAVGHVAPQLRVAARGLDGVIEAIEHSDPTTWILGVQWPLEDTYGSAEDRVALFTAFLNRIELGRHTSRTTLEAGTPHFATTPPTIDVTMSHRSTTMPPRPPVMT